MSIGIVFPFNICKTKKGQSYFTFVTLSLLVDRWVFFVHSVLIFSGLSRLKNMEYLHFNFFFFFLLFHSHRFLLYM